MSPREERFLELSTAWAVGALEAGEVEELRELVAADPAKLRVLRELEETALHLPLDSELVEPPSRVREEILERVRVEAQVDVDAEPLARGAEAGVRDTEPPARDWASRVARALRLDRPKIALAATAALVALVAGLSFHTARLERDVETAKQRVVDLSDSLAERERLLEVLESARVELVALEGLDEFPRASGKILWDTERGVALLQLSHLPPLPPGEAYQFWVFPKEGEPASAGVFAVARPEDDFFFRLDGFPASARQAVRGFLVTREAEGGAAEPGELWYLGARLPD
jgi:anti-sigma-K factor RskA